MERIGESIYYFCIRFRLQIYLSIVLIIKYDYSMKTVIRNVKTWVKGGPGHGFLDADGKPIDIPDIEWDQIEEIELNGVKSVKLDYTGPYIAGEETIEFDRLVSCLIDEGEYEDVSAGRKWTIRLGSMICKPQIKGLERI